MKSKRRILYVVNQSAFFLSHRLSVALAAVNEGYTIELVTGFSASQAMEQTSAEKLVSARLTHHRVALTSAGTNPMSEGYGLLQLIVLVCRKPYDLLHCVSPKGNLYGGIAARICRIRGIVLAVSGMGFAFTGSNNPRNSRFWLAKIYSLAFRFVLRHRNLRVIVQNEDDRRFVTELGALRPEQVVLIPGSGVPLERFTGFRIENKTNIVLLPARMLWDKGVAEFIEAAKILKPSMPSWRFVLAGAGDYDNPSCVPIGVLESLNSEGVVEWIGHLDNLEPYFERASIVCLPSYREGMPKCLLEAAAAGCAVVTTDVVGCREAIVPNATGLLVPARDGKALGDALGRLMLDRTLREEFGRAGRALAIDKFGEEKVIEKTLLIYKELLEPVHE